MTVIRRGRLTDAANYTSDWTSPDQLVRVPLGMLWFDDTLGHFKRSPQPWFVDGAVISYPQDWMAVHRGKGWRPCALLPPVLSDVYTGRVIASKRAIVAGVNLPERDLAAPQPNRYQPPTQKDVFQPEPDQQVVGERMNRLTGEKEPRAIAKSYGCNDYGHIYTIRNGTPVFGRRAAGEWCLQH